MNWTFLKYNKLCSTLPVSSKYTIWGFGPWVWIKRLFLPIWRSVDIILFWETIHSFNYFQKWQQRDKIRQKHWILLQKRLAINTISMTWPFKLRTIRTRWVYAWDVNPLSHNHQYLKNLLKNSQKSLQYHLFKNCTDLFIRSIKWKEL